MSQSVIGALRVNLGLDAAQFSKGAKDAQQSLKNLGADLQKIGAGIALAGAGIALAVRRQLTAADEMGKAAQSLGVPVEALSQLAHAADLSGASFGTLETGLRVLSKSMVEGEEKFAALGIALRDEAGAMRGTGDVLADFANVLAAMPDGAEKTALALDVLGRSGSELIPMLNAGAVGLREMMAEAEALGLTITPEMARSAAEFNDNITRLQGTLRGLWRQVSAELAPVM